MPDMKRVTIVHADGREYSILPADFTNPRVSLDKKSYAEQGFRIVGYVTGEPYAGPTTQREIEQATEMRTAAREEQAAQKPVEGKAEAKGKD